MRPPPFLEVEAACTGGFPLPLNEWSEAISPTGGAPYVSSGHCTGSRPEPPGQTSGHLDAEFVPVRIEEARLAILTADMTVSQSNLRQR
jgi:hypothetical protein